MTVHHRRLRLLLLLSLALPLAACAAEEVIGGATPGSRSSADPSDDPVAAVTPSPTPPVPDTQMIGLLVTPASVTLTSDPLAPLSARSATFSALAVAGSGQRPTTAQWVSNPGGRLTVTQAGVVTVLPSALPGIVEIRASSESYLATASVSIVAALPTVQSLQLSATELALYAPAPDQLNTAGFPTSAQLTATVHLSDASTEGAVTWSVLPADVATVDQTGRVTALKKGTAYVTARSVKDTGVSAQCTVTVAAKSQVEVVLQ